MVNLAIFYMAYYFSFINYFLLVVEALAISTYIIFWFLFMFNLMQLFAVFLANNCWWMYATYLWVYGNNGFMCKLIWYLRMQLVKVYGIVKKLTMTTIFSFCNMMERI